MSTTGTSNHDDPEKLLNEWLGELKTIIGVSFGLMITEDYLNLQSIFSLPGLGHENSAGIGQ